MSKNYHSSDKDLTNDLLEEITGRMLGVSKTSIGEAILLDNHLSKLNDYLKRTTSVRTNLLSNVSSYFGNVNELSSLMLVEQNSIGMFQTLEQITYNLINNFFNKLDAVQIEYEYYVEGKLDIVEDNQITSETARAVKTAQNLADELVEEYFLFKEEFPKIIEEVRKQIAIYNDYLKERFTEPEDKVKKNEDFLSLLLGLQKSERKAEYVKIKLVNGNPVLTDVLLNLVDYLPAYREKIIGKGRNKKKLREVSKFDVEQCADKLIALSNPVLLNYFEAPKDLFTRMGDVLQRFDYYLSDMDEIVEELLKTPRMTLRHKDSQKLNSIELKSKKNRSIKVIKNASLDGIVQIEDDYLPDNKKEVDYFKVRNDLLNLLYASMKQLSKTKTDESKIKLAEKTVKKAVDLKADIDEILRPAGIRKLRTDKQTDNEYYEGKQGEIGTFYFERAPTPNIKLSDVKGASFDDVKKNLSDIVETASFPHVMRLSSPGGKVRSNILLIGPYGCGKTELARAVCADPRTIGAKVSVAGTLTAWMHESVNNVKRVYDSAKELYVAGREMKPVVLVLDEFDGWFSKGSEGYSCKDMEQIENVLLEVLDGMGDYNGIITMGMTNKPWKIPHGIMRRFRYVNVVGQLTKHERADLLKLFLEKTLPVHESINEENYLNWAEQLKDSPGDVVRKVVDELHFNFVPKFLSENPKIALQLQKTLQNRESKKGSNDDEDIIYLKEKLSKHILITPKDVNGAIEELLGRPSIRMQINDAKALYDKTEQLLESLANGSGGLMGFKSSDSIFGSDETDY